MFPRPITQRNEGQPLHCGIIIDSHLRFVRRLFHLKEGAVFISICVLFPAPAVQTALCPMVYQCISFMLLKD